MNWLDYALTICCKCNEKQPFVHDTKTEINNYKTKLMREFRINLEREIKKNPEFVNHFKSTQEHINIKKQNNDIDISIL